MNKTININLGGVFFHIDEVAYHKLKSYLDAVRRSLSDDPKGQDEIITDIESRIGELLSDKIKDVRQVINENDINEVIDVMGKPEDYIVDEDVFTDDSSSYQSKGSKAKKLYRDGDDKFLGGVSSGMSHYLNIDAIWIRLIWLVLASGGGVGVIAYIILWILLPEANTTAEKLEMMGEPVNISNIERKIKEELSDASDRIKTGFDDVSEKVKSADYQKYTNKAKSGTQDIVSTIGSIFSAIFKVVGKLFGLLLVFISIVTIISLIIGMFTVGSIDFIHEDWFYQNASVYNNSGLPIWLVSLITLLLVGIPFFFIFMLGLRILSNNSTKLGKTARLSLLGIWMVVLLSAIFFGTKQFIYTAHDGYFIENKDITGVVSDTLNIKIIDNEMLSSHYELKRRRDYSLVVDNGVEKIYSNNILVNILSTDGDQVFAKIKKKSHGKTREDARESAAFIDYNVDLIDNDVLLNGYFLTDSEHKFREQKIYIELYLPENQVIYLDKSTRPFLYDISNIQNLYDSNMAKHYYQMTEAGLNCIDCESEELDSSSIDINTPESFNMKINEDGIHIEIQDKENEKAEVKIDMNGIKVESSTDSI